MELELKLELAIAEICSPEGCQVNMIADGRSLAARYSALVQDRIKIRPGQMVAVDLSPEYPEIVWRWYRTQVVEVTAEGVSVNDRGVRQLAAAWVAGLESDLPTGAEAWVSRLEDTWEIHDRVLNGAPAHPDRLRDLVLPRIAAALSAASMQ